MVEETFKSFPDGDKYKFTYWMRRDPEQFDGNSPVCPVGAENGPEPWTITNVYHSEYGYAGYFGYNNPEVDEILENAQFETNLEEAEKQYIEAQKLIEEDLPGLPMYYSYSFSVNRDYMTGIEYNPFWRATFYYPQKKGT
jgi:ABC-type transport system substrate-binding protein